MFKKGDLMLNRTPYLFGAFFTASLFSEGAAELEFAFTWWQALLIVALIGFVLWWALADNVAQTEMELEEESQDHATDLNGHHGSHEVQPAIPETKTDPTLENKDVFDDLKVIEGIGPKISGILNAAGIKSFLVLANTTAEEIQKILDEADIRLGDPTTWPDQAQLAASGDWEKLEEFQDQLKGGRRV